MKEQFLFLLYFTLFLLLSFKFSSSNTAFSCTRQQHFFIFLFLRQSILSYRQIIPKTIDKYFKKQKEEEEERNLRVSLVAQQVMSPPAMQETAVQFLSQKDLLEKGEATHSSILGSPLWLSWYRIRLQLWRPGLGRSPREGKGYSLQYSGLENSMDCIIHGVAKNWIQLSDFHFQAYNSYEFITR